MSLLSPRLQLRVAQKQILTPGLVQMVTVLQLNRLELKEMIAQEIALNPVLEEHADGGEELTPEEVQALLEAERVADPADQAILDASHATIELSDLDGPEIEASEPFPAPSTGAEAAAPSSPATSEAENTEPPKADADPFDEIDFGSFFDDYLDPGYKSSRRPSRSKSRPSRPSCPPRSRSPTTCDRSWRSRSSKRRARRGRHRSSATWTKTATCPSALDEIAESGEHELPDVRGSPARWCSRSIPSGVGARDLRECLLLQIESRNGKGGVAWQIVSDHLKLLETRQFKEIAKVLAPAARAHPDRRAA